MNITINGEEHYDLPEDMSVAQLLEHLLLPPKKVAVERNLEIVSKSTFETTILSEDDRLEIIHFIGGG